jgi:diguanylate cyclase (GGDEF)-like protein
VLLAIVAAQTEIAASALELTAVMDLVCREARQLTGADRAVIELGEGGELVRRAGAGATPSHVGSMLSVPLIRQGRAVGVLKAMSGPEGAFDERDEATLELLGGVVAAQLLHARDVGHSSDAALEDGLTGLGNRRAYEHRLASETERAIRHGRALTLAIVDVDHLDAINETRGHAAGDEVLRRVSRAICGVRVCDYGFRIGGDRFALLMPETTERQAEVVVRRIAHMLGRADRFGLATPVSIGTSQARHRDPEILHTAAEDALARARRAHAVLGRVA